MGGSAIQPGEQLTEVLQELNRSVRITKEYPNDDPSAIMFER